MFQLGMHAVVSIFIYLVCIGLSFEAVKSIKVEKFMKMDRIFRVQIFLIFLAIALGFVVGQFIIALIDSSLQLSNFF